MSADHACVHLMASHQCWCAHEGDHAATDYVYPESDER